MKSVCLWSGPRNVSTALMYSFAQRNDTRVIDEPLYGHFLRVTGASHPGRDEVLANVESDGNAVMRRVLGQDMDKDILFMKQMAHHLVDIEQAFLLQTINIFLIRDPHEMLPSLTIQLPHAQLADTGLKTQWQLFEQLTNAGQSPVVLDSRELLRDPEGVLRKLCEHLQIPYMHDMLTWEAGPRPEDGIWAKYWYHAVHESRGFSQYVAKQDFPAHLEGLLNECEPWYRNLFEQAIRSNNGERM